MSGVFISYRREDSQELAGRLFDRLTQRFGKDLVFRDIDAIDPGANFAQVIGERIGGCDALVALIGKGWLDAKDAEGRRRLDLPRDFVKAEIGSALAQGKLVIPALIEGTPMPPREALPAELAPLADRNALPISDSRFGFDVGRLISAIDKAFAPQQVALASPVVPRHTGLWARLSEVRTQQTLAFVGAGIAAVVGAVWAAYLHFSKEPTPQAPTANATQGGIAAGGNVAATAAQSGIAVVATGPVTIGITLPQFEDWRKKTEREIGEQHALEGRADKERIALLEKRLAAALAPPQARSGSLPAYGADLQRTSVSGISSGAFMAVQLQVAYSHSIIGAGVVAGGPYYCAANNVLNVGICMGQVPTDPPNPLTMANAAKEFAGAHLIDPLSNLSKRRIYAFSGTDDNIVRHQAVEATVSFFQQVGVPRANLEYVHTIPAGHAVITRGTGSDCSANAAPYINHCADYDQAGAMLKFIYGPLKPRVATPVGKVISFSQRAYASAASGMADIGYLYVPQSCAAGGAHCKVHVAIHGCLQSAESVGNQFYSDTGYNNWADSNDILVLYPQVNRSEIPYNPQGCWDWWGYTGKDYVYKSSLQMSAIMTMVDRLAQPR